MNQKNLGKENIGVLLVLASALLWGLFPVLVNQGVKSIPPITFAALSTLLAAVGALAYALLRGTLSEIKNKKAYFPLFMITICIAVIPYILFFIGAKMTSGINASMLLLSEIIFTLIFTHFIGEKTTALKLLGTGGIFSGALFIVYNGSFSLNLGDILIILSTLTYPLGNFYSKKALNYVSPSLILFVRSVAAGLLLLVFALFFESKTNLGSIISQHWLLLIFNGLVLLGLSKIFWYESIKRVDLSKAIALVMTFPLFSLVALVFFFNEKISIYQWIGISIMMIGVYFSVKRRSVDPKITKYAPS